VREGKGEGGVGVYDKRAGIYIYNSSSYSAVCRGEYVYIGKGEEGVCVYACIVSSSGTVCRAA